MSEELARALRRHCRRQLDEPPCGFLWLHHRVRTSHVCFAVSLRHLETSTEQLTRLHPSRVNDVRDQVWPRLRLLVRLQLLVSTARPRWP